MNDLGKCFLFVTALFIGEQCVSLLTLLKTGLSKFCSEKLLQIGKDTFQKCDFVGESDK